jgi:cysteine synthase
MNLSDESRRQLRELQHFSTPFFRHPADRRVWVKHDGLGLYPAHKFRSMAWLTERAIDEGIDVRRIADRSSGSWAMGGARVAHVLGGESRWITVGPPPPAVRAYVEVHGGQFLEVGSNPERIVAVERLRAAGWWCPDQHANPLVIDAFGHTLGEQLAEDLRREGVRPRLLVAAQGTGGTVAGVGRALRRHGLEVTTVAADLTSSITHGSSRSWKPTQFKVRGVGSDDEVCGTLRVARADIDEVWPEHPFRAAECMRDFFRLSSGCGMSGGLALAVLFDRVLPRCRPHDEVVVVLTDAPMFYPAELAAANQMFGSQEVHS